MGGELGRDVMKPGRSLIRILFRAGPREKAAQENVVTYPPQQALTTASNRPPRSSTKPPSYLLLMLEPCPIESDRTTLIVRDTGYDEP